MLQQIIMYGGYVDAVYENTLKQDYPLPQNPNDDCVAGQEAWVNRNRYIRYMTLNVMDYRTTWLYMHPTIFPEGVHVSLERTIFSDTVGSHHYHNNEEDYYPRIANTFSVDGCNGYNTFVYPQPSRNTNRLSYLRGTGKDFVRSLKVII
jgi:hypothetical protein